MSRHTLWAGPADGFEIEAAPFLQTDIWLDIPAKGIQEGLPLRTPIPNHPRALYRWNGTTERYEYDPKESMPA